MRAEIEAIATDIRQSLTLLRRHIDWDNALRRLDVKLRSVVVCRLLLDWSVDETADALRIKPGTVKSRLHRALAMLERSLGHMR